MGKDYPDPRPDRRAPYNQPIKIYEDSYSRGMRERRLIREKLRRGLRRRLGDVEARVGRSISERRECAGLSVAEFAQRIDLSPARVKKIEAGKGKLTVGLLQRIASALGCLLIIEIV